MTLSWWLLSALAEQWPYAPRVEASPALAYLAASSLYPAIEAVALGNEATALAIVIPLVSEPPSLDIKSRAPRHVVQHAGTEERGAFLVFALPGREAAIRMLRETGYTAPSASSTVPVE